MKQKTKGEKLQIYLKAVEKEKNLVTDIMTDAFNYDAEIYFGKGAKFGPLGYSDSTLAHEILQITHVNNYFICLACKQIVGFISIDIKNELLNYFCIRPNFINQEIATANWA